MAIAFVQCNTTTHRDNLTHCYAIADKVCGYDDLGVLAVHYSREVLRVVSKFFRDVEGATAVEYGIIATAMFLAIIPAFIYVSTGIMIKFQSLTDYFTSLG